MTPPTDTERLDFLQTLLDEAIALPFGREPFLLFTHTNVREAIDNLMKKKGDQP